MTTLGQIAERYAAAASVASGTVDLFVVADEPGAYLDAALKRLIVRLQSEDPEVWQEILSAARAVRWRLATNPAPASFNPDDDKLRETLRNLCTRRSYVADDETKVLIADLADRSTNAFAADRPTGAVLLESLRDLEYESCAVVTASGRAQSAVRTWFKELGVGVPVLRSSFRELPDAVEQAYAIGSPALFGSSLVTAPRALALAFIVPSWVQDRTLPKSALADYAESAIRPNKKIFKVGNEPTLIVPVGVSEEQLTPTPSWARREISRLPLPDEVVARKVLLSGGLAIMLDQDGEHIRCLHPERPAGARVELSDVSAVTVGSYLVLREGATQSAILYDWAIELLADRGPVADSAQTEWKDALRKQIARLGTSAVVRALAEAGVRRADRASAWTRQTMVRPQDDDDFVLLLKWLGLPRQPYFELASALRRARLQASQDVREILEDAVSSADLEELERDGFLRFELDISGFRSIIATRVLAISPDVELVHRQNVRRPTEDWSARWLE